MVPWSLGAGHLYLDRYNMYSNCYVTSSSQDIGQLRACFLPTRDGPDIKLAGCLGKFYAGY